MTRKKGREKGGETNLASEFYVASQLFRLGYNATITLGHTKEIDLVVTHPDEQIITIDVKGTRWKTSWPLKPPKRVRKDHFFVFLYYKVFEDLDVPPEVFVVPARQIKRLVEDWVIPGVPYNRLKNSRYEDAWGLLFGESRRQGKKKGKGRKK